MIPDYVTVTVIADGVVEYTRLFIGERETISTEAEEYFLSVCRERLSNFDEYDKDDIQAILDNGYEEFGNGSICLCWPEVADRIEDQTCSLCEGPTTLGNCHSCDRPQD